MPNVMFEGAQRWLPEQWKQLLNAMVDADTAIVDDAPAVGAGGTVGAGPSGSSGGAGPSTKSGGGQKRSFTRSGGGGGNGKQKHRPPRRDGPAPAGAGGAPAHATAPSANRVARPAPRWADPRVQAAWDAGNCINCLGSGHIGRDCRAPRVQREKLPHLVSKNK